MATLLPAMRHDLPGEQGHGLSDHGRVHQPALVEIADELVHAVLAAQFAYPFDAILRIAKHAHLAVDVGERHAVHAGQYLAECLEALDVVVAQWPQPLAGLAHKAHQPRLAFRARLLAARRYMHREGERGVAGSAAETLAVDSETRLELVRRVDHRRREDRKSVV